MHFILSLALIPAVEYLCVHCGALLLRWQDDIESSRWLKLLRLFTAMKDFHIFTESAPYIAPILQELRIRREKPSPYGRRLIRDTKYLCDWRLTAFLSLSLAADPRYTEIKQVLGT